MVVMETGCVFFEVQPEFLNIRLISGFKGKAIKLNCAHEGSLTFQCRTLNISAHKVFLFTNLEIT
jgi:hypothetical protein